MTLIMQTTRSAVLGLIVLGLIVFLPAGTLVYWQGWVFIIVFTISANTIGLYLLLKNPALLARRLKVGPGAESRPVQKVLIAIALAGTVGVVVVSAFDYRFGWSFVPTWLSVFGDFLAALGLAVNLQVVRANSYGAATIEKMEGQKVISSGPYALVRHPMYADVLVMLVGVPPALASWWGCCSCCFLCRFWSCVSATRRRCCGRNSTVTGNIPARCVSGFCRASGDIALTCRLSGVFLVIDETLRYPFR